MGKERDGNRRKRNVEGEGKRKEGKGIKEEI
jgi:hypothetical protein